VHHRLLKGRYHRGSDFIPSFNHSLLTKSTTLSKPHIIHQIVSGTLSCPQVSPQARNWPSLGSRTRKRQKTRHLHQRSCKSVLRAKLIFQTISFLKTPKVCRILLYPSSLERNEIGHFIHLSHLGPTCELMARIRTSPLSPTAQHSS
jgi:hypothetical protein